MNLLARTANPLMKLVLRSPLHGLASGTTMLVTFTGRMTGKRYTTPVNYTRDGDVITFFSHRSRIWWRNLRDGVPVTVRVRGRDSPGIAHAVTDAQQIQVGLLAHLAAIPDGAKYYNVKLDDDHRPNAEDVAKAAQTRVMIRVDLR